MNDTFKLIKLEPSRHHSILNFRDARDLEDDKLLYRAASSMMLSADAIALDTISYNVVAASKHCAALLPSKYAH